MKAEELMYFNEFGGFSKDGKEYIIKVTKDKKTPVPWSHVISNDMFGTLVTSNGGGFSWFGNSRENKISSWCNDVVLDTPSEEILLEDQKECWSAYSNKILENEEYEVIYGFGYAEYKLSSKRYEQKLDIFVTDKPYQKIGILKIKNLEYDVKKIKVKYKVDVVLGVSKEYTKKHIVSCFENNYLKIFNRYSNDYSNYNLYLSAIDSKDIFLSPLDGEKLGIQFEIELKQNEEKEIVFVMDYREIDEEVKFEELEYYKTAYENVKIEWKNRLEKLQITTPIDSMNIILNGWMIYQTLTSRVWGRASFYQSGGAFGFRDQLQDMLAILYIDPDLVKKQIEYHAKHQFKEGDVLHWWHPERNNGIRTRFSDDLLWLVYVVCEYIQYTGDFEILIKEIPFSEGRLLEENEDEIYIETKISGENATLLEHCLRAINRSLDFGEHGLPKMGSGDWNDGMNMVSGESVWLGFFLGDILKKFLTLVKDQRFEILFNMENKKEWNKQKEFYELKALELKRSLEKSWDGRWFRRAYFKTGEALGSNQNDECKIDNISQSWSVISGLAQKDKQVIAMESVENYLVDYENMFIKLLTPAFCKTKMEPGYIKAYIPGVRENGGQYTHGAIWAIIANCLLNKKETAVEYFRMLNPIEHARTKEDAIKYKVEPYVISADIYSHPNLIGRGGWSWYTGSSSWYYVAGIKYILGLNKCGEYLEINPKIPQTWNNCHIRFNIDKTNYIVNIIRNTDYKNEQESGNETYMIIFVDNEKINSNRIKIILDGQSHVIDVMIK